MSLLIDLNSDLGEMPDPLSRQRDIDILSIVSSCNIACGGHAGDEESMRLMIIHAAKNKVRIGAHPSYPDKENFGRQSIQIDAITLRNSLHQQIGTIIAIAKEESERITYVKPHGALYNDCADDTALAQILVRVIKDIDNGLSIMGLPNSQLEKAAQEHNIGYIAEAFIDRRYTLHSRLQSRSKEGAVITDKEQQRLQTLALIKGHPITTAEGKQISIKAQSLCMHSDSPDALANAEYIRAIIIENNIEIRA